jgi:hypothetical protein
MWVASNDERYRSHARQVDMNEVAKPAVKKQWSRRANRREDTELLKETVELLAKLPSDARITRLAVRFPRIANKIATDWSRPEVLKPYLSSLLIDERGDRQGFPGEIVQEILRLSRYYDSWLHPAEAAPASPKNVWGEQE